MWKRGIVKKFTNDGKTFIEVLALILTAIFYPGVNLSMTAQTRESACGLIEDKFSEIMGFYPLLMECVEHYSFTKDKALIVFKNPISLSPNSLTKTAISL